MNFGIQIALAGLAIGLVGCSSVSLDEPAPTQSGSGKSTQWEPAPQGGGYYLDDGPGSHRPKDLHNLPDAVPVLEPIAEPNKRTYTVMGQTFSPQQSLEEPYRQEGRASWYGRKFHGAKTANGEIYDMYKMTAAHPTLPLPSYARVTNLDNGKEVIVRVNDRGPFLRGRIIDLSYAAALKLDYINHGSARVRVEKFTPDMIESFVPAPNRQVAASNSSLKGSIEVMPLERGDEVVGATHAGAIDPAALSKPLDAAMLTADTTPVEIIGQPVANEVVPLGASMSTESVATIGSNVPGAPVADLGQTSPAYFLQLGAFGLKANAQSLMEKLSYVALTSSPRTEVKESKGLFKVFMGPFDGMDLAGEASKAINEALNIKPILVEGLNKP